MIIKKLSLKRFLLLLSGKTEYKCEHCGKITVAKVPSKIQKFLIEGPIKRCPKKNVFLPFIYNKLQDMSEIVEIGICQCSFCKGYQFVVLSQTLSKPSTAVKVNKRVPFYKSSDYIKNLNKKVKK